MQYQNDYYSQHYSDIQCPRLIQSTFAFITQQNMMILLLLSLKDVQTPLLGRYGVFLADSVIGPFISLSLQLAFSFYLFPIFACILIYSIISGHYIFSRNLD